MYYIYQNQDGTKTVVLTFLRNELLNDLDGYGFVEGDVQKSSEGQVGFKHLDHGKHQTQDITQDGNIDIVTRWLNLKLAWCREALYPYTKNPVMDNVTLDDILTNPETYTISMTVPEDFSETTAQYLEELIHNLLVWYVLFRWLSITKPEGAAKWKEAIDDIEPEIKGALARKCYAMKRPTSPFGAR